MLGRANGRGGGDTALLEFIERGSFMHSNVGRLGLNAARRVVVATVAALMVVTYGSVTSAAAASQIEWSTTWTQEETVTVTETATIDGFIGTGKATATATATATGSASASSYWEVYYWAVYDAYTKASNAAKAKAAAEARPIAKMRAEIDAQAKADAANPPMITWSTTATVEKTVTVTETATVGEFVGYGTATATATATATGTATAATNWEVYYYATMDAYAKAGAAATAQADAEARALAKKRALADAQAQADAAANPPGGGTDPGTSSGPCGPEVLKSDGTPWECTFADGFQGTSLDLDKWSPVLTSETNFTGGGCFLGLGPNIVVKDGSLQLTTQKEDAPVTCDHPRNPVTSDYTSGSVTSTGKFSQTYGRFAIRAAMPATDGAGSHSALWLTPADPTFYGAWPHSGEIDIVEYYSALPDRLIPYLHYVSNSPDKTNTNCLVYDPTEFHTYLLEWTASKLTISIDGTTCVDHTINPLAPLLGSAPFDKPFVLNLTQGLGQGDNALPAGATIDKATLKIDYVRVWA